MGRWSPEEVHRRVEERTLGRVFTAHLIWYRTLVPGNPLRRIQPLPAAVLLASVAYHVLIVVRFAIERAVDEPSLTVVTYYTVCTLSAMLVVLKYGLEYRWQYTIALALHIALAFPMVRMLSSYEYGSVAWAMLFVVEMAISLPLPWSLPLSGVMMLVYVLSQVAVNVLRLQSTGTITTLVLEACGIAAAAAGAALFTSYRERLVWSEQERERLDASLSRLAAANMSYQAYALDLEERSVQKERQRITRDIHDIVGYTLTNNIIMMEAAVDMIRKDPLGVPRLLHSVRENAEQGLEQIRAALYQLRAQSERMPEGVGAIARMVQVFQRATGVEVRLELGGVPFRLTGEVSSIVHHFVQEGLINSFRHGRATQVLVMFYLGESDLAVNVWDNGKGAETPKEGIGISGMRERADQVGGSVSYENAVDGFSITLRLPKDRIL